MPCCLSERRVTHFFVCIGTVVEHIIYLKSKSAFLSACFYAHFQFVCKGKREWKHRKIEKNLYIKAYNGKRPSSFHWRDMKYRCKNLNLKLCYLIWLKSDASIHSRLTVWVFSASLLLWLTVLVNQPRTRPWWSSEFSSSNTSRFFSLVFNSLFFIIGPPLASTKRSLVFLGSFMCCTLTVFPQNEMNLQLLPCHLFQTFMSFTGWIIIINLVIHWLFILHHHQVKF